MGPTTIDKDMLDFLIERQKPYWHTPVNLGIREFKKAVRALGYPKSVQSLLISRYKKRSWMEFDSVSRGRGNFPTHTIHGNSVELTSLDSQGENIPVRNKTNDDEGTTINVTKRTKQK